MVYATESGILKGKETDDFHLIFGKFSDAVNRPTHFYVNDFFVLQEDYRLFSGSRKGDTTLEDFGAAVHDRNAGLKISFYSGTLVDPESTQLVPLEIGQEETKLGYEDAHVTDFQLGHDLYREIPSLDLQGFQTQE